MNEIPAPIAVGLIAGIVRRAKEKTFFVTYVLTSGKFLHYPFDDEKRRNEIWARAERYLLERGFVPHWNMCLKAESLTLVERHQKPGGAEYVHFRFRNGTAYKQRYVDTGQLTRDYARLCNILAIFQDRRTNCPLSHTKH
ncbi:MAG: hypothetical protein A3C93_06470 [Candidatus Lloydbacteria bacterium RIFCSPHIGHO2_02_FULL_54_17]|uniref:Uncharacterized protein n=1 Tax=Candidatus Lloydbacteria bacterium RIFCSPHIGHO2_02_FULL_54_17 TaxID=1798664 RepID=A0A1G2DIM0_9BACT|nr:MAG: hypothetical protein A2762_01455 [Candidatus Lloydbacteria bacterium RIFCSPHIGHO2_01_FULL_54_11]OGZ12720.1 MAG: hypothetical protein A3C93_06470 [Candidatus Lloydbacteria bacterium RIFCSPHIGHO2_02_FULL_54_17]OGZ13571.1 MAG: hypothetical protein A2948_05130 [Candidatus Lloydbacteria bacterium RIFCSPLOWO2_01_FULL_54_18]